MTSGPVVVQVLEGEGAIARYRDVMGATDPKKAAGGTSARRTQLSIGENSVQRFRCARDCAIEIAQSFPVMRSSARSTQTATDRRRGFPVSLIACRAAHKLASLGGGW